MDTQMWMVLVAVLVGIIIFLGGYIYFERKRSRDLQARFGPEYDRTLNKYQNQRAAEAELRTREERVKKLHIVPLSQADGARFSEAWRSLQNRFVDSPKAAVEDADREVRELMEKRGYPMGDFERRAADISVDHPSVVENYRRAHEIALRNQGGTADTEELRKAIVCYRALFDELLEVRAPERTTRDTEHREGGLKYGV
jgi:hypothetical protein